MGSPTRLNRSPQTSNGEFIRDLPRFQRILPEKPGTFFGEDGVDNAVQELNRPHRSGTQWRPLFISAMRSLFVCCLIRLALLDVYHVLYGPLPEDDSPPPPLPLRNATDTERIADFWYGTYENFQCLIPCSSCIVSSSKFYAVELGGLD